MIRFSLEQLVIIEKLPLPDRVAVRFWRRTVGALFNSKQSWSQREIRKLHYPPNSQYLVEEDWSTIFQQQKKKDKARELNWGKLGSLGQIPHPLDCKSTHAKRVLKLIAFIKPIKRRADQAFKVASRHLFNDSKSYSHSQQLNQSTSLSNSLASLLKSSNIHSLFSFFFFLPFKLTVLKQFLVRD